MVYSVFANGINYGIEKKNHIYKAFESANTSKDTSANICESMLKSAAFKDLSKNQRLLYLYMKAQYFGKRKPRHDYPDQEQLASDELFYFPMNAAADYDLYTRSNKAQFYSDIGELVSHGFIEVVSNGKKTKSRTIYKYSSAWKTWNDSS